MNLKPVSVYIHTPFCPSKCGYCDFNSYAMSGDIIPRTVDAILQEIEQSPWRGRPAKTIYFGGGTPTFLSSPQLASLLKAVINCHPPIENCEITSEANPGTVDSALFKDMYGAGFNRLSIGAQSFNTSDLIRLGRIHEPSHVGRALGDARHVGFDNVSIDLMFALPGQSLRAWETNLDVALSLMPEHLSLYCLTIEPNTRYYRHHIKGLLDLPNDEIQVQMYDLAIEKCAQVGYEQYEISNFSKPGRESRHNLCYWRSEEYLSYGPGAVGCFDESEVRTRYTNLKHPDGYSTAVESKQPLWCESEILTEQIIQFEKIMMGIRLNQGLGTKGQSLDSKGIKTLLHRGWIEQTSDCIRLTPRGRHFCTDVALELAPAE